MSKIIRSGLLLSPGKLLTFIEFQDQMFVVFHKIFFKCSSLPPNLWRCLDLISCKETLTLCHNGTSNQYQLTNQRYLASWAAALIGKERENKMIKRSKRYQVWPSGQDNRLTLKDFLHSMLVVLIIFFTKMLQPSTKSVEVIRLRLSCR